MNPVRVQFVRDKLLEVAREEEPEGSASGWSERERSGKVLAGMDVLDVGCGGGLLSESLARLGARTVGIDASASNIAIAQLHAAQDPALSSTSTPGEPSAGAAIGRASLEYRNVAAEELVKEDKRFDVVCSMEVLEHVDNPADFLVSCAELVKPGGHLFLSTISRTPLSYFLTIFAAEKVLRMVEPGTHTHEKFVKPSELLDFFSKPLGSASLTPSAGLTERPWISRLYDGSPTRREAEVRGLVYLPWKGEWFLAPRGAWGSTECNYVFWVRKPS